MPTSALLLDSGDITVSHAEQASFRAILNDTFPLTRQLISLKLVWTPCIMISNLSEYKFPTRT